MNGFYELEYPTSKLCNLFLNVGVMVRKIDANEIRREIEAVEICSKTETAKSGESKAAENHRGTLRRSRWEPAIFFVFSCLSRLAYLFSTFSFFFFLQKLLCCCGIKIYPMFGQTILPIPSHSLGWKK